MPERHVFNIAEGKVTEFQEIVDIVKKILPKCSVEIVPGTAPVSRTQHLDIGRAKKYLGWEPQYSMEQGFRDYIEDLKRTMQNALAASSKTRRKNHEERHEGARQRHACL